MYLTEKAQKIIKVVAYFIEALLLALVLVFGCVSTDRGKTIKNQKAQIKALTEQVDSLQRYCNALGAENVLTVNVAFELNQKNVLSFAQTNAQNIAKEISTMTRKELYDSLYTNKPTK